LVFTGHVIPYNLLAYGPLKIRKRYLENNGELRYVEDDREDLPERLETTEEGKEYLENDLQKDFVLAAKTMASFSHWVFDHAFDSCFSRAR
jgi:hypothetical protein